MTLTRDNWWEILSHCDEETHAVLRRVCKGFNALSKEQITIDISNAGNKELEKWCEERRVLHLIALVDGDKDLDWHRGLQGACKGGHRDIAKWMIEKGARNWNWGLHGACRGGHRDLAEWMIEKGARDLNDGLWGACYGGHREIAEWMTSLGAKDWNWGLNGACLGGQKDLAEWTIKKGVNNCYHCRNSKHPQLQ